MSVRTRPIARAHGASYRGSVTDVVFLSGGIPDSQEPGGEQPAVEEPLDAYSRVVVSVAARLTPSVASLRVSRRIRGGRHSTVPEAAS